MTIYRLGYACINTVLSEEQHCVSLNRTCRLKNANRDRLSLLAQKNSADLIKILRWNDNHGIKFFRISSGLFPFMDHPDIGYSIEDLYSSSAIKESLKESGQFALSKGHKLELHPGPYCCLGSPNIKVVNKSILCLEMHSLLADLLGYGNELKINIHIGGTYGDKASTAKRFCNAFSRLSKNLRTRLVVENDDKFSMWSINSLYHHIYLSIGIPITFDYHHWNFCHEDNSIEKDCQLALSTWDCIPTTHYSESAEGKRLQAHSDFIKGPILDFSSQKCYDVMIEAKSKEQAVLNYEKNR